MKYVNLVLWIILKKCSKTFSLIYSWSEEVFFKERNIEYMI